MRRAIGIPALVMLAGLALAGCNRGGDPILMHLTGSNGNGPDEFAIVPNRPLEMPPDLTALPPPAPDPDNWCPWRCARWRYDRC